MSKVNQKMIPEHTEGWETDDGRWTADDAQTSRPSPIINRLSPLITIWRSLSDWWRELLPLSLASFAWAALSLVIIGGPPAAAALYVMCRAAALHEQPDIRLFVSAFRAYFVRSWLLGAIGLAGLLIWVVDLGFYWGALGGAGSVGWLGGLLLVYIGVVWLQTLFYAWPLMVCRPELPMRAILRDGVLLSLRYPLHNLVSMLFVALMVGAALYLPPLAVLVMPPLVALLGLHNLYVLAPDLVPEDNEALRVVA